MRNNSKMTGGPKKKPVKKVVPVKKQTTKKKAAKATKTNVNAYLRTKTSPYKGVSKLRNSWQATISFAGKSMYIGIYPTPEKAARAYNAYYKQFYGKNAYVVKPMVK